MSAARHEIEAAISKAVELRALHAALVMQGNSSSSAPNCLSRPSSHLSAQDYPVFTPSYQLEQRPLVYPHHHRWDGCGLVRGDDNDDDDGDHQLHLSDSTNEVSSSRRQMPPFSTTQIQNFHPQDNKSISTSCTNHLNLVQASPEADDISLKSTRRTASMDLKSITTCNTCTPANINSLTHTAPLSDSHSSSALSTHPKNKGPMLSWLFPRLKKKQKNRSLPPDDDMSQTMSKDMGGVIMSIEALKKQLLEANENKAAALMEVSQMKSSLGELKDKLDHLEIYCQQLNKALKQTLQPKDTQSPDGLGSISRRANTDSLMPLTHRVMVESFLQIVCEARLSVKHFCKTLHSKIEEMDNSLMERLNMLLQPYRLNLNSKHSNLVLYHLQALINQSLYQDFENCVFQNNGSPKVLDPNQHRHTQFSSFVSLRNLSWNEVVRKGTKYYSQEFSRFCDQKMSCIITTLNWTKPWPEQLLQAFFVAAKCMWLLHLLAFSFNPPLGILRIEENSNFDPLYMEDMFVERQRLQTSIKVKIMVMPGFYVHDQVLKCKVLCKYIRPP